MGGYTVRCVLYLLQKSDRIGNSTYMASPTTKRQRAPGEKETEDPPPYQTYCKKTVHAPCVGDSFKLVQKSQTRQFYVDSITTNRRGVVLEFRARHVRILHACVKDIAIKSEQFFLTRTKSWIRKSINNKCVRQGTIIWLTTATQHVEPPIIYKDSLHT